MRPSKFTADLPTKRFLLNLPSVDGSKAELDAELELMAKLDEQAFKLACKGRGLTPEQAWELKRAGRLLYGEPAYWADEPELDW